MKKIYTFVSIIVLLSIVNQSLGQVSTNGGSGLNTSYGSLAGAINDLNTAGTVSGNVVITLEEDEFAPAGGFVITATGTGSFSIIIDGGGNKITAGVQNAGNTNDAIFKIVGGDYITIQNFTLQENSSNTISALATNTKTEFGIALYGVTNPVTGNTSSNGAQNNTIQNNIITLDNAYTQSIGIMSTSTFISTDTISGRAPRVLTALPVSLGIGGNSYNHYYGNNISNVAYGIMLVAPPATGSFRETDNDIGGFLTSTGNTISFGNNTVIALTYPSAQSTADKLGGITVTNTIGVNIGYNTVTSALTYTTIANNGVIIGWTSSVPAGFNYTNLVLSNTIVLNTSTVTAAASTYGIDFGYGLNAGGFTGTSVADGNNITINQTTSATTTAAVIAGIKGNYTTNTLSLTANTISINQTSVSTFTVQSPLTGILAGNLTSMNIPVADISQNTITFNQIHQGTAAASITSALNGIVLGAQSSSIPNVNVNFNNITVKQAVTSTGTFGGGSISYINVSGNAAATPANYTNLRISSNNLNTLGSTVRSTGTLVAVNHDFTNVNNLFVDSNIISIDRTGSGTTYGTFASAYTAANAVNSTISANNISLTGVMSGSTAVLGLNEQEGNATMIKDLTKDTININFPNISAGGQIGITYQTGATVAVGSTIGSIANCIITIATGGTSITGAQVTGTGIGIVTNVNNNSFNISSTSNSVSAGLPVLKGVLINGGNKSNVFSNNFLSIAASGIASSPNPSVRVIDLSAGSTAANRHNVYSNIISNVFTFAGNGSPTVDGIYVGAVVASVYKNKIYGLTANTSGPSTLVSGIRVNGITTTTDSIHNNIIGFDNSACPNASNTDAVRGINIVAATTTCNFIVTHNTIYLNAAPSGAVTNYGTTGIFHTTSTTAANGNLVLRNNIIVNNSTPKGTGLTVALRRSSFAASTVANYSTASNNNLFYAGSSTGSYYIYYDGNNAVFPKTLAQFKAYNSTPGTIAPRETNSVTENPPFLSTLGSSGSFLHINTTIGTVIESGGMTGTSVADDYDTPTDIRCPGGGCPGSSTKPDLGADEMAGTCPQPVAPTNLILTATYTGNFTGSVPSPSGGYFIVRTANPSVGGTPQPQNGTDYTPSIGTPVTMGLATAATPIVYTTTTTFNNPVGAGSYIYWVFSYNTGCGASPNYSITSASSTTAACGVPAAPTTLVLTPVSSSRIDGSFTSSGASGYLVVRTTTNVAPGTPSGYYTAGSVLGTGIVVASSSSSSFSATGLGGSTAYWFWVYAYNDGCLGSPAYFNTPLSTTATTLPCLTPGVYTVGPAGNFSSIGSVITALQCYTGPPSITGAFTFEFLPAYNSNVETFPILIPFIGGTSPSFTITFRPQLGATNISITSNNSAGTLLFQGVGSAQTPNNFIFDGRPGGAGTVKQLTIQNANVGSSYAVQFENGANNNTIQYCKIQSSHNGTSGGGGTINFGSSNSAAGNSTNTIDNNDISDASGFLPTSGIYSNGVSTAPNTGNIISNNNIYNFFNAGYSTAGINLAGYSTSWNINGNSFYETVARAFTSTTAAFSGILSSTTTNSGLTIQNNFIGGTAASAGGTPLTITGNGILKAIQLTTGTTASSVQNNTISNIAYTSSNNSSLHSLINLVAGTINVGTVTGNTLGSQTGTGSITISLSDNTAGVGFSGILGTSSVSGDVFTIKNNTIGSIAVSGASTAATVQGINISGATGTYNIIQNTVGSPSTLNSFTSNLNTTFTGIYGNSSNAAVGQIISNNTITNLAATSSATKSYMTGIYAGNTGLYVIGDITNGGNIISNLSSAGTNTSNYNASGIVDFSTTSGQSIQGNIISNINSTSGSANVGVVGIYYSGPASGVNNVERNFIHSLNIISSNINSYITGIQAQLGNANYQNNMIRLGITASGTSITNAYNIYGFTENGGLNNIYTNSIYIGGTGIGAGSDSYAFFDANPAAKTIRNNIFWNARSNVSASTPNHYAIVLFDNTGTDDYNDILATGTGKALGYFSSGQNLTLAAWRTASSRDANSYSSMPGFINPATATPDLHIASGIYTVLEAGGNGATPANDFDNQTRGSFTPIDLGADAIANPTPVKVDVGVIAMTAPAAGFGCYSNAENVTITLKNYDLVNPINFGTTPVNISVQVTGIITTTLNFTINSGSLAANSSANYSVGTLNMSAYGTYNFKCTFTMGGTGADKDLTNDEYLTTRISTALLIGTATSSPVNFCGVASGTPTISVNSVSGGTVQWYEATVNNPLPNPSWTAVGTNSLSYTPSTPISTTHYYAAGVTCGASTVYSNIVTVTVSSPSVTGTSGNQSSCGPSSFSFSATVSGSSILKWYDASSGALAGTGSPFVTPVLSSSTTYNAKAESATGTPSFATFGTGTSTNTTTGFPAPFTNWYGGTKHQMMILASELIAAGVTSGNMTSLTFFIESVGSTFSGTLQGFTIYMGSVPSSVTDLTTTFASAPSLVYGPYDQSIPSSGPITLTFDAVFNWDGASNIIIQTSYSNGNFGTSSDYVKMYYTPTSTFTSTSYFRQDLQTPATILAAGTASATTGNRPNMKIGYTAVCSSTASAVTATINPAPTPVTITPSSATICLGQLGSDSVKLVATGGTTTQSGNVVVPSGTVNVAILDDLPSGSSNAIPVTLPSGASIDSIRVNINMTHTWDGDMIVDLQSPNGQIVNLINRRGGSGDNFTNTQITSNTAAAAFSGNAPFANRLFRADLGTIGTIDAIPATTTNLFSDLFVPGTGSSQPWTLRLHDAAAADVGTLSDWTITIFYKEPVPVPFLWTPAAHLFTNFDTSSSYTNQNLGTVFARPWATATYTVTATLGTCSQTQTVTITPNGISKAATGLNASPSSSCASANVTLTQTGGTLGSGAVWKWYTDASYTTPAGGILANLAGLDPAATVTVNPAVTTTYYLRSEGGTAPCAGNVAGPAAGVTITINPANTWLGINTDWNNTSNWCPGIPTAASNITIPTTISGFYPILTGAAALVNNLTITGNGNITISNTGTLRVSGTVTSPAGKIDAKAGIMELNGSAAQTLRANHFVGDSINDLIISNTSGAGVTIDNTGNMLKIISEVSFGNNSNQKFNTSDLLTLKSSATSTARIADVTNNSSNTGNDVIGKVVIERFIPARRAWRLLNAPIKSTTLPVPNIFNQWQESAQSSPLGTLANPNPGFGTHVSKGIPAVGTFDQNNTGNSSVFYLTATGWNGSPTTTNGTVAGTNTGVITDHPGYMLFVRGNRATDLSQGQSAATSTTVLRTTGNINITSNAVAPLVVNGDGGYIVGANTYNVFPNPYPSAISFEKLFSDAVNTGIPNSYYVWDASIGGSFGVGGFVTVMRTGPGSYSTSPNTPSLNTGEIQSGMAFQMNFPLGILRYKEAFKVSGSNIFQYRPSNQQVRTTLIAHNDDGTSSINDGTLILFDKKYDNRAENDDASKIPNFYENFSIVTDGKELTIEKRKPVSENDTILFRMAKMRTKNYQLAFAFEGLELPDGITAVLEDLHLKKKTALNMQDSTYYDFSVAANTSSADANRFRMVFKKLVSSSSLNAYVVNSDIAVNWKFTTEFDICRYEIEKSIDGASFVTAGIKLCNSHPEEAKDYSWLDVEPVTGVYYYRVKCVAANGVFAYTDKVKVIIAKSSSQIYVFPNPVTDGIIGLHMNNLATGKYYTTLMAEDGKIVNKSSIIHIQGAATEKITPKIALSSGSYKLEISTPAGKKIILKVIAQTK